MSKIRGGEPLLFKGQPAQQSPGRCTRGVQTVKVKDETVMKPKGSRIGILRYKLSAVTHKLRLKGF